MSLGTQTSQRGAKKSFAFTVAWYRSALSLSSSSSENGGTTGSLRVCDVPPAAFLSGLRMGSGEPRLSRSLRPLVNSAELTSSAKLMPCRRISRSMCTEPAMLSTSSSSTSTTTHATDSLCATASTPSSRTCARCRPAPTLSTRQMATERITCAYSTRSARRRSPTNASADMLSITKPANMRSGGAQAGTRSSICSCAPCPPVAARVSPVSSTPTPSTPTPATAVAPFSTSMKRNMNARKPMTRDTSAKLHRTRSARTRRSAPKPLGVPLAYAHARRSCMAAGGAQSW
mmetsp:Transcript_20212/g.62848  ORF Transcript_20212/g.62848 Transcript_20212/m.62848 type:complete len:288 (-) Transcript_20212:454-1317(-)